MSDCEYSRYTVFFMAFVNNVGVELFVNNVGVVLVSLLFL